MTRPRPIVPGAAVPLDAGRFREVELRRRPYLAVGHGRLEDHVLGGHGSRGDADRTHANPLAGGLDLQVGRGQGPCQPDRLVGLAWVLVARKLPRRPAVDEHPVRPEVVEVLDEEDVREPARRDRAEVVPHAEVLGPVHRRHLDRDERVDPLLDCPPDDPVHVPVGDDRVGEYVVGDE